MWRGRYRQFLIVLFLLCTVGELYGQSPTDSRSLREWFAETDSTLVHQIYQIDDPVLTRGIRAAHRSGGPVMIAGGPAVFVAEAMDGDLQGKAPVALLASQGAGLVLQYSLKALIQRPRPYARYSSIQARSFRHPDSHDRFAFPSGHASLAFATAVSLSMSYPRWYVIGPSVVWAGGVAFSRPWLGVHYTSDILAGAVLGTAVGVVMHAVIPCIGNC